MTPDKRVELPYPTDSAPEGFAEEVFNLRRFEFDPMTNEIKLPQADMLADDIFGNQKEWYEKSRVVELLTAKDTAHQKELQKAREEERAAFKDLVELWFLRLRTEPMQWRVEQAMKSVFGSQE